MTRPNHDVQAPKQMKNRRTYERVVAQLPISAVRDEQIVHIEASNISEGGAYCQSAAAFDVMTRVAVSIELPDAYGDKEPVRLDAIVVRCEAHLLYPGCWNLALF